MRSGKEEGQQERKYTPTQPIAVWKIVITREHNLTITICKHCYASLGKSEQQQLLGKAEQHITSMRTQPCKWLKHW